MVLKAAIEPEKREYFQKGLKKNLIAIYLVNQYNKALVEKNSPKEERFDFTRIGYLEIGGEIYILEPFIQGNFEKYTNNTTYVNEKVPLVTALSHHSFQTTNGKFMVTDLQGHNNLLTDPVIHTEQELFNDQGDLGKKGMENFFTAHECNRYCSLLGLKQEPIRSKDKKKLIRAEVDFDISTYFKKCMNPFCNKNTTDSAKQICPDCLKENVDIFNILYG